MPDKNDNKHILLLNGPNLNLLGKGHSDAFEKATLEEIEFAVSEKVKSGGYELISHQTNHIGVMIDLIQEHSDSSVVGIIIGMTHCDSISIRDALDFAKFKGVPSIPLILLDILNHRKSLFVDVCVRDGLPRVYGLGLKSYLEATEKLLVHLDEKSQ